MAQPHRSLASVLTSLVTGPSSRRSEATVLALIGLVLISMTALRSGILFAAALVAILSASLLMAIRGVLAHRQAPWYAATLRIAGVILLVVAVGSSLLALVGTVVTRFIT